LLHTSQLALYSASGKSHPSIEGGGGGEHAKGGYHPLTLVGGMTTGERIRVQQPFPHHYPPFPIFLFLPSLSPIFYFKKFWLPPSHGGAIAPFAPPLDPPLEMLEMKMKKIVNDFVDYGQKDEEDKHVEKYESHIEEFESYNEEDESDDEEDEDYEKYFCVRGVWPRRSC
jgi:hypothetical protein